jgi:WD40 repeat protein
LFSANANGNIKLWNVTNGKVLMQWNLHCQLTHFLIANERPNKSVIGYVGIGTDSSPKSISRIELSDKGTVSLKGIPNTPNLRNTVNIITSATDSVLLVAAGNVLSVHRGEMKDKYTKISNKKTIRCVAYSNAQQIIAFGDESGAIKLYYPSGENKTLHWHPVVCYDLEFSADGNYLYSVSEDGNVALWNLLNGHRSKIACHESLRKIAISPSQDSALVVTKDNRVLKLDLHAQKSYDKFSVQGIYGPNGTTKQQLTMSFDARTDAIILNGTNVLQWYDIKKDQETRRKHIQYKALSFNPSRYNITKPVSHYVTHVTSKTSLIADCEKIGDQTCLKIWNMKGDQLVLNTLIDTPHGADITSCKFSQAAYASPLVTTSLDGTAKLWDKSPNGKFYVCYAVIDYKRLKPYSADFSPDGSVIAISFGRALTIWDTTSASLLYAEDVANDRIQSVKFLSDEQIVFQSRNQVSIYELGSMKVVWQSSFTQNIIHFDVHNQERRILIVLSNSTVYQFDVPVDLSQTTSRITSSHMPVLAAGFNGVGEVLILSNGYEVFKVQSQEEAAIEEEEEEELDAIMEEALPTPSDIQELKPKIAVADKIETSAFDPDQGPNAWKQLFSGYGSHQLVSMQDSFSTYMNTFLLKSDAHKEQAKQKNQTTQEAKQVEKHWFSATKGAPPAIKEVVITPTDTEIPLSVRELMKQLKL